MSDKPGLNGDSGPIASTASRQQPRPPSSIAHDGDVEARSSIYADNDDTVVSTTRVDITYAPADLGLTFSGGYLVDTISTASVDVISAATRRWRETRHQGAVGLGVEHDQWAGGIGYQFSDENDWTSHTISASISRDFFMRNTNLALGYGFVDNAIYRADDDNFEDTLKTHSLNLSLSQVLGRRTNSRFTTFIMFNEGRQSSVYRYVPVGGPELGRPHPELGLCIFADSCPLERHPRSRTRYGLQGAIIHALKREKPSSLRFDYRFYNDSWWVMSHVFEVTHRMDLTRRFQLRSGIRAYYQREAYFYKAHYIDPLKYMSLDRELSRFGHVTAGNKISYKIKRSGPFDDLRIDAKVDLFFFKFLNFAPLPYRLGGVFELGVRGQF